MESGALPAVLSMVKAAFPMSYTMQGLLGGVVYLTTAIGAPMCSVRVRPAPLPMNAHQHARE